MRSLPARTRVELVNAYPLNVTASRGAAWAMCTDQQSSRWVQPDWWAVSRDYDGVHLTALGYLSTAGRALATEDGVTVLAGWEPDCTFWLTETLTRTDQDTLWASDEQGRVWTQPARLMRLVDIEIRMGRAAGVLGTGS